VGLLHRIFYLLGTPTPEQWKELDTHTHYRDSFPQWRPQALADVFPKLANDPLGLDLLSSMLQLDPSKRITATAALEHPWLAETRAAEAALRSHCWQPDSPSAFAANLASALQTAQFQSPASSEGSTYTPPFRQPAAPAAAAGPHAAGAAQPPRPSRLSRSSSGVHVQPLPPQEQQQQLRAGTTSLGRFAAVARQQAPVLLSADPQQQLLCTSPSELPRPSKAAALQQPAGNIKSNESDQDHHSLAHHQQHMGPPRPPARPMPRAHHQPATAAAAPGGVAARGTSGMLLGPGSSTYMPSERA
jgi:serine/threonine protein kinase